MPFSINQKRISVYQALFLHAGYQAILYFPPTLQGLSSVANTDIWHKQTIKVKELNHDSLSCLECTLCMWTCISPQAGVREVKYLTHSKLRALFRVERFEAEHGNSQYAKPYLQTEYFSTVAAVWTVLRSHQQSLS